MHFFFFQRDAWYFAFGDVKLLDKIHIQSLTNHGIQFNPIHGQQSIRE